MIDSAWFFFIANLGLYLSHMKNPFISHPHKVGESYIQHFGFAVKTGIKLILWGVAAMIHGVFPFIFTSYVSTKIKELYHQITERN